MSCVAPGERENVLFVQIKLINESLFQQYKELMGVKY
jgi:hypothetical protein